MMFISSCHQSLVPLLLVIRLAISIMTSFPQPAVHPVLNHCHILELLKVVGIPDRRQEGALSTRILPTYHHQTDVGESATNLSQPADLPIEFLIEIPYILRGPTFEHLEEVRRVAAHLRDPDPYSEP